MQPSPQENPKETVLFLCTGNSARSQMAEAFLRRYAADRYQVHSAGLAPKSIHPNTRQVMQEIGYDLAGHTSKGVDAYLGKVRFAYLITVCDQAEKNCPTTWPGVSHRLHWSFEDPAAFEGDPQQTLEKFREVRDLIDEKIRDWLRDT